MSAGMNFSTTVGPGPKMTALAAGSAVSTSTLSAGARMSCDSTMLVRGSEPSLFTHCAERVPDFDSDQTADSAFLSRLTGSKYGMKLLAEGVGFAHARV